MYLSSFSKNQMLKYTFRTLEAWLKRMDDNRATVLPIIKATYGK